MFFDSVEKVQVRVENTFAIISSGIIAFMMALTTVDVILRYIFNRPLPGVFDLCEMMMVGTVYFAIAYVQQKKGHVRVDVFIDRITGSTRSALEMSFLIVSLAAFGIIMWQTGVYAWDAWVTGDHTTGVAEYPLGPARSVLPLGILLLCLRFITDIRRYFLELKQGSPHWPVWTVSALLPLVLLCLFLFYAHTQAQWAPINIGWIILIILMLVLFGGLEVSFAMLVSGIIGYWIISGLGKTLFIIGAIPYDKMANYTFSVIPLFILMGHFAFQAGFATSLYRTAEKWIGHMPGGLAQATVLGGSAFAAACGSGLASCATLAKICIPAMREVGVDKRLAIGVVAGTGTIAQMIPPSILMVIYAIITDQSVAKLLIAGIIPGIIAATNYSIMIYLRCKLNPKLAPVLVKGVSWKERFVSLRHSWGIAALGIIVLGGIYTGIFTPTEAGALGASAALLLGCFTRKMSWANFRTALIDSTKTTGMLFLIIAGALVFSYFLAITDIPTVVSDTIVGLKLPRIVILLGVLLMYTIAGAFINMLAFAFLTLPIIFPAIVALGYDPIWFGVLTVHMFEIAAITPPLGLNLFIIRGIVPDSNMSEIFRGIIWFCIMDFITLGLYITFPQLATWLPSLMS